MKLTCLAIVARFPSCHVRYWFPVQIRDSVTAITALCYHLIQAEGGPRLSLMRLCLHASSTLGMERHLDVWGYSELH